MSSNSTLSLAQQFEKKSSEQAAHIEKVQQAELKNIELSLQKLSESSVKRISNSIDNNEQILQQRIEALQKQRLAVLKRSMTLTMLLSAAMTALIALSWLWLAPAMFEEYKAARVLKPAIVESGDNYIELDMTKMKTTRIENSRNFIFQPVEQEQ